MSDKQFESKPSVCIIGAGFSGIAAGIKVAQELTFCDLTIFESNSDVGGVWLTNVYPGIEADAMFPVYSYSFERSKDWSSYYAPQKDIQRYIKNTAIKYKIYSKIKFCNKVTSAVWDQILCKWKVSIFNLKTNVPSEMYFNFIITHFADFSTPNIPKIFNNFSGPVIHSAKWDSTVELENKTIGVVGSGASAVQIIPEVAKIAKTLHCFQRRVGWMVLKENLELPLSFAKNHQKFVRNLGNFVDRFITFNPDNPIYKFGAFGFNVLRRLYITDEPLRKMLTPTHPVLCTHPLHLREYFNALEQDNVVLHIGDISEVNSNSVSTEDSTIDIDVLILGTGFDVQIPKAPNSLIGLDGIDVWKNWIESRPITYLGITSPSLPNLFFVRGPNTHTVLNIAMFECQSEYIVKLIKHLLFNENKKVVLVKEDVANNFMFNLDKTFSKTVFNMENTGCKTFGRNENGFMTTEWPMSLSSYRKMIKKSNFDQYIYY